MLALAKKRPRTHVIEDESTQAFQSALSRSNFVVRKPDHDYGVDFEVEIFEAGEVTGLTFKVQMKSTDNWQGSLRIAKDDIEYWISLDVPVLVVFYDVPSDTFHACWAHSLSEAMLQSTAKKLKVTADSSIDIRSLSWQQGLINELYTLRNLRRGYVPSAVPITIEIIGNLAQSRAFNSAITVLLNLTRRTPYSLYKVDGAEEPALTLQVSENFVEWKLPIGFGVVRAELNGLAITTMPSIELAEFILLHAAAIFEPVDTTVVRSWMSVIKASSVWWASPMSGAVFAPLFEPNQVEILLGIHANTVKIAPETSEPYGVALMGMVERAHAQDFATYAKLIRQEIAVQADGGVFARNLGTFYGLRGEPQECAELLEEAQRLHIPFQSDPSVFVQLGLTYGLTSNFDQSVLAFQRAIAFGGDVQKISPQLAFSLTYTGRYAEAKNALKDWEPRGLEDSAGVLFKVLLEEIVDKWAISNQERCACTAQPCPKSALSEGSGQAVTLEQIQHDLLEHDALDYILWSYLTERTWHDSNYGPAVATALLNAGDPHFWVGALEKLFASNASLDLIEAVAAHARFLHKEVIYEFANEYLNTQQNSPTKDAMIDFMNELYHAEG